MTLTHLEKMEFKKRMFSLWLLLVLLSLWGYISYTASKLHMVPTYVPITFGTNIEVTKENLSIQSTRKHGLSSAVNPSPRVCCAVLTDPLLLDKTVGPRDTWTRRCDKRFFMSSKKDDRFPTIGLGADTRSKSKLIVKMARTWMYLYDRHLEDCDYFVKGDPDTYMIIENLKAYLKRFDPKKPQHFGHVYTLRREKITYLAGGPGEVLSQGALRVLVEKALRTNDTKYKVCHKKIGGEDKAMGQCLVLAGSECVNTRDDQGRPRFIVYDLDYVFRGKFDGWYRAQHTEPIYKGSGCCSDFPIGFHYVTPERMHIMEYIFYQVHTSFDLGIRPPKAQYKDQIV